MRCSAHASLAVLLAAVACTETAGPEGSVANVVLVPGPPVLVEGDTTRLVAGLLDSKGAPITDRSIVWATSDPSVAVVSSGLVTAIARGTVTITAGAEGVTESTGIRVVAAFRAVNLDAGAWFTCAVDPAAGGYCWGENSQGALGTGQSEPYLTRPAPVSDGRLWARFSLSPEHACGLTMTGLPFCWGDNWSGAYGPVESETPVPLPTATAPLALVAGLGFTCALETGLVECWGNQAGTSSPQFTSLTAGIYHVCGLVATGEAYCWGDNSFGGLGDGTTVYRDTPTAVGGGQSFASLDGGYFRTCGVDRGGAGWCWGYNSNGRLGDGTTTDRSAPAAVAGGITFSQISVGHSHTCGLSLDGMAYCWGMNNEGQLGNGSTEDSWTPVPVAGALRYASISAGDSHTCAVELKGIVYCWGNNWYGQLGDSTTVERHTPVKTWGP